MPIAKLRVFVSSPGDVEEERVRADALLRRLALEFAARAELERVEQGDSDADRWQLEQRIRHAENQLNVAGRV